MDRLFSLRCDLEMVAASVGPQHSWWDVIFDIDAFRKGQPTIITHTVDEWIAECEQLLAEHCARRTQGSGITPEQAGELLRYAQEFEKRRRRYELEGGQRRRWDCKDCGFATEAETKPEAHAKLVRCGKEEFPDQAVAFCRHENLVPTDILMPPADFS